MPPAVVGVGRVAVIPVIEKLVAAVAVVVPPKFGMATLAALQLFTLDVLGC